MRKGNLITFLKEKGIDMFIFIDVTTLQKELKRLSGHCKNCERQATMVLFKTYQCIRVFFIPIWHWGEHYYLVDEDCGARYEISEEDGVLLHYGKKTVEACEPLNRQQTPLKCPSCKRVVDQDYEFCPFCGAKRK